MREWIRRLRFALADWIRPAARKFEGNDRDFPVAAYADAAWREANREKIVKALVLDTETTGTSPERDAIIEFGGRLVEVNRDTGEVLAVGESYQGLQDPGRPLEARIVELTGITDDMLKGKAIDWAKVDRLLAEADLVIAHNAQFDRTFLEAKSSVARDRPWACTVRQMNWAGKGFASAKLESLARRHGYEVDAHRAFEDVNSLLFLLTHRDASGHAYFRELILTTEAGTLRVEAIGSPYDKKDLLKSRGYSWNGRVWWRYLPPQGQEEEARWLAETIYDGQSKARFTPIAAKDRYRPW